MHMIKRIRDPVHGLITFDFSKEVDKAAWRLINTSEFQRLRRVKQLGVSEFTFPGATHTRLSHSIGVFHLARRLMDVAERYVPADELSQSHKRTALLASLLHDLGHGPFSHAFENAEKARIERAGLPKESYRDHEQWTAELIQRKDGDIRRILREEFGGDGSIADDIAEMLRGDRPDLYSSVVSSSFDADRLDYLQRDRMMTGSGAGAIDLDWLLDNLRVVDARVSSDESPEDSGGERSLPLKRRRSSPPRASSLPGFTSIRRCTFTRRHVASRRCSPPSCSPSAKRPRRGQKLTPPSWSCRRGIRCGPIMPRQYLTWKDTSPSTTRLSGVHWRYQLVRERDRFGISRNGSARAG